MVISVILAFVMLGGAAALLTSFCPRLRAALRPAGRRARALDAAVALGAAVGFGLIVERFQAIVAARLPAQALLSIGAPDLIVSLAPALSGVASAARTMLLAAAALVLAAHVARRVRGVWPKAALALVAAAGIVSPEVRTLGEFGAQYAGALFALACGLAFCWWFARDNELAWGLVLWTASLRPAAAQLLSNSNPAVQLQGWLVVAVMAAGVAWALLPALRRSADSSG